MNKVIYPGTFDPFTVGHVDIVERGLRLFDRMIIAVSRGIDKQTFFDLEERVRLIAENFKGRDEIEVRSFEGLLIEFAKAQKIRFILRGLRTVSDFEYEFQMAAANRNLASEVDTLFMMTDSRYSHLSSSLIREILHFGGSAEGMVPPVVERKIKERLKK